MLLHVRCIDCVVTKDLVAIALYSSTRRAVFGAALSVALGLSQALLSACVIVKEVPAPNPNTNSSTGPAHNSGSKPGEKAGVAKKALGEKTEGTKQEVIAPYCAPDGSLILPGRVEPDTGKEIDVSSRLSGKVIKLFVEPGQTVQANQMLASIESRDVSELEAELVEAKSKLAIAEEHLKEEKLIVNEQIERPKGLMDARTLEQEAHVQRDLAAAELKRCQSLYREKIIAEKEYTFAKAKLASAEAALEQAQYNFQREEHLYKDKALMKREFSIAQAEVKHDLNHVSTLKQRLIFLGMSAKAVDDVLETGKISGVMQIYAPGPGIITHFDVAAGEVVHPDLSLFKITDLSNVVVSADLPESDLSKVKIGNSVSIDFVSYPNEIFKGKIHFISHTVKPETHTFSIKALLANKDGRLNPNMSCKVTVPLMGGD